MELAIRPDFLPLEFEGKKILVVKIEELIQTKKPCYYKPKGVKHGSYTRVGDRDELMTDYEIYALESYNYGIREDLRPNKRASLEDLNELELNDYVKKIKIEKEDAEKVYKDSCLYILFQHPQIKYLHFVMD